MAKIAQIIKYEGDNSTFVWKSPMEDFNTETQLIVHESQEAVFYMNGQALDLFGPGRYTLETQNIPLIRRILSLPTGRKTPFHCEVYFINKTHQMAIKWGTDSQVQYMEPTYRFPLQIGASGEMVLSINDSRKLLVKIVGTENGLTQNGLVQKFRSFLMSKIKPYIAQTMQQVDFSIFEIDSHMGEFSSELQKQLRPDFNEYGVKLEHFFVTNIAKPEGETAYETFKELHIRQYSDVAEAELEQKLGVIDEETLKKRKIIEAEGIAEKRRIEGYTYQQERGFEIAEKAAQNEGAGDFSSAGIGLGLMSGVAGGVGGVVGGMTNDALQFTTVRAKSDDISAFKQRLEKLLLMKEMGTLSEIEYESARKKLLESI